MKTATKLALLLCLLIPQPVHGQFAVAVAGSSSVNSKKKDHAARSLAAIDLAILAAESGVTDVSVEALKRAVAKGPPVKSVDLGGLLSTGPRPRSSSRNNAAQQDAMNAQTVLAKRLVRLHKAWNAVGIDPQAAYQAWKELVLPSGRPNEAFAYSTELPLGSSYSYTDIPFEYAEPTVADCAALALVEWAREAGQLDDLGKEIENRRDLPGAAPTILLIQLIQAQHESVPSEEVEALCLEITKRMNLFTEAPQARLYLGHAWKALQRLKANSPARREFTQKLLSATRGVDRWPKNGWLEFFVARNLRQAIASGDVDRFKEAFSMACSRYDSVRANNSEYVASREANAYAKAAQEAFSANKSAIGIYCLRAQSKVAVSDRYGTSVGQFMDANHAITRNLLKLSPQERGTLLNDLVWNQPALGLRNNSRMKPAFVIPELFASRDADNKFPLHHMAGRNTLSMSLLEWAMRDALAVGAKDDIIKRIEEKEAQGSDDAALAKLVFQMAKDEPIELKGVLKTTEKDGKGEEDLRQLLGDGEMVLPLDVEVARQALQLPEYREHARRHIDRMLQVCMNRHYTRQATWLRKLRFDDKKLSGNSPQTHQVLKHWHVANDVSGSDYSNGNVPETIWVQRGKNNGWGQEFGTEASYLLLRYPLKGNCKISLRAKDGLYEEGGVLLDGVVTEFHEYENSLRSWGLGNRGIFTKTTESMADNIFNTYHFTRQDEDVLISVGDGETETTIEKVSDSFPFFGLSSYGFRATSFDSIKIEGDVTIPRQVELLSPSLLGWSAKFKQQRLRNVTDANERENPRTIDPKKHPYDWQLVDGVCESIDHSHEEAEKKKSDTQKRKEALIQYLRPLEDGDEVTCEFYHEPGKFSLAPSIGRVAIDLSEPKVALHWITADSGGQWTRVWARNRKTDKSAKQLMDVELNENDWNALAVRLEEDEVVLKLNGKDVYRRRWENESSRFFGLFHDPTKYHVRVRNVVLKGNWPEKLPDDLFEVGEKGKAVALFPNKSAR